MRLPSALNCGDSPSSATRTGVPPSADIT